MAAIEQSPQWPGAGGIDHIHQRQERWRPCQGNAKIFATQQQKCLGKPCQRQQRGKACQPPESARQARQLSAADRYPSRTGQRGGSVMHRKDDDQHAQHGRNHGHPKGGTKIIMGQRHQRHGQQGAEHRAHGIHRLTQAVGSTTLCGRRNVSHQRIARCAANALADTIKKTCGENCGQCLCQRKQGLGDRTQSITSQQKRLAPPHPVADGTRKYLDHCRSGFSNALDDADRQRARTQHGHHVKRQQAVYQL